MRSGLRWSRLAWRSALGILAAAAVASNAAAQQGRSALNVDANGVILHGYDAVAYQTEQKAVRGSAEHTATFEGAIYRFACGRAFSGPAACCRKG